MSGSPVFIDGRLIGAIGYGWKLTDQRTAMVTPIHDMLKLLDRKTLKELEPQPVKPALEKPVPEKPAEKAPPVAEPVTPPAPRKVQGCYSSPYRH